MTSEPGQCDKERTMRLEPIDKPTGSMMRIAF
jgi:hypothetical protein